MVAPVMLRIRLLCVALTFITGATGQGGGSWELLLQNAGIASMHTAVTHYNTAVLIDRTDIGASQLPLPSGVCRDDPNDVVLPHDCSAHSALLDLETNTVRPLTLLTDTWCSSGQFLPDGTLLHSGGWNDGPTKFRLFTPCLNNLTTCDWEELPNTTSLSQGRWYASNQILPNGSVIIVGGIGIHSIELYPPTPAGAVDLQFLAAAGDDQGDNIYPFVFLLPNGNLFIFANNQSVLYDYVNNVIVRVYPDLEGGPRNYPSAGSSVMLALEGDCSNATVVVCGGAQYGAFNNQTVNATAKGSCGRIVATDPDPFWEMDEMPLVRIMGDMVMLPTGHVLIINGAQAGSQGYGLATQPCLTPVLYQPDEPLGSRFFMLNPGTIPRMYHSTANLLPDGRVLLAGSNSNYFYTFDVEFPTELRIEAFSPPYLDPENAGLRPVLVKTPKTMRCGVLYNAYVTVPSALNTSATEVNIASAPYATHSFSQGQRVVKLNITRSIVAEINGQYRIVFQAPPNLMVAPPSYYMIFVVNQGVPSIAHWVQVISS